jgi:hypothetical protein
MVDLKELLNTGKIKVISNKQKTGEFDQYKYCFDCDRSIIGGYEAYGKEILFSTGLKKENFYYYKNENGYFEAQNIDYAKLKLMFLSILLRADISDREIFSQIDLGIHRDTLREMVFNKNPKSDIEYPVFLMRLTTDRNMTKDFMVPPIKMKVANENGFAFILPGLIVIFTIGISGIPDTLLKCRIQDNGVFRLLNIPLGGTIKLLNQWYNK